MLEDDGTTLGSVIAGAPLLTGRTVVERTGEVWHRFDAIDRWPIMHPGGPLAEWFIRPSGKQNARYAHWEHDGLWVTQGGTDTSRSSVTQIGGQTGISWAWSPVTFRAPNEDSTEAVIGSAGIDRWADRSEFYFRARFSVSDSRLNWAVGLWGNQPFVAGARGSAFQTQTGTWDGAPNISFDGIVLYGFAGDSTAAGDIDKVHILAIGATPGDTVWAHIDLEPDVPAPPKLPGEEFDVAFHSFGWDSVQYVVNGVTGTMDLRHVRIPLTFDPRGPLMGWRCALQDAGTPAPGVNQIAFTRAWAAVRPREE